ncbi:MAG: hypothetical protein ACW986_18020 [Promethearchaeota archaeon]|jgi:hypothetical protein
MVKRFVAYILFGSAAVESLTLPLLLVQFRSLWEQTGMPPNVRKMAVMSLLITTLTIALILFCIGLYILIKSRKSSETMKESKKEIEDKKAKEQESTP